LSTEQRKSDEQFHMGRCFEKGMGIAKSLDENTKYSPLSADQQNVIGQSFPVDASPKAL
jgi:TPR repeat protein